jgi:hypothetical protein
MKKIFCLLMVLLILPSVLAIDLDIEQKSVNEVIIGGIEKPAVFELEITNNGVSEDFKFYNLFGFIIEPSEFRILSGETETINLEVYPIGDFKIRGFYTLNYYIKGSSSEIEEKLLFKVIDLEDAFEVGSEDIDPDSDLISVYIHNKQNFNFDNVKAKLSSNFFEIEEEFSLGPYEKKIFSVEMDKEDINDLSAGFYTIEADIEFAGKTAEVDGLITFEEKNVLTSTDEKFGFIINTITIKKENEGNVLATTEFSVEKNLISRLFTSFNDNPDVVQRKGVHVTYTWDRELSPGEDLEVVVKTNWTLPFIICFLIIFIIVYAKRSARGDIILRKKVNFVKAKGGEFALKITIFVQANNYVEKIHLVDRLPPLVKIYERFGAYEPSRVDEKARRVEWNFEKLEANEVRTISYVIYSKVGILGRFALPRATAIFERMGKIKETVSNRAFFVAEQRKGESDL